MIDMPVGPFLLIGGPADGSWLSLAEPRNFVYVPAPQQPVTLCEANRIPPKTTAVDRTAYRLEKFRTPCETYFLYCYDNLSVEEMFGLLLKNYRGSKNEQA